MVELTVVIFITKTMNIIYQIRLALLPLLRTVSYDQRSLHQADKSEDQEKGEKLEEETLSDKKLKL